MWDFDRFCKEWSPEGVCFWNLLNPDRWAQKSEYRGPEGIGTVEVLPWLSWNQGYTFGHMGPGDRWAKIIIKRSKMAGMDVGRWTDRKHEEGRWKTGEANQRRIEVQDRSNKQLAFAVVARYEIGSLMKVRFTHVLPILENNKFLTPHIRQTFTCGSIRHKQQDGHEVTLLHNCCYLPASVIQDAVREICLR